jgi:hypothetical protein
MVEFVRNAGDFANPVSDPFGGVCLALAGTGRAKGGAIFETEGQFRRHTEGITRGKIQDRVETDRRRWDCLDGRIGPGLFHSVPLVCCVGLAFPRG